MLPGWDVAVDDSVSGGRMGGRCRLVDVAEARALHDASVQTRIVPDFVQTLEHAGPIARPLLDLGRVRE